MLGHEEEIRALAFSSDGNYLASGSSDKLLYVWNMDDYTIEKAQVIAKSMELSGSQTRILSSVRMVLEL
ncbi:MAG: WD40 repeat domain-containing protein [Candidatus Thorarchaeota archaeon]